MRTGKSILFIVAIISAIVFTTSYFVNTVSAADMAPINYCWCKNSAGTCENHRLNDAVAGSRLALSCSGGAVGTNAQDTSSCSDYCRFRGLRAVHCETTWHDYTQADTTADPANKCITSAAATPATAESVAAPTSGPTSAECNGEALPVPITLGISIGGRNEVSGLPEYINIAYRYLVSIILVVAIVMVVYGGFLYLLGSAGLSSVQRGKQIIKDALIGTLIVLGAYSILQIVNTSTTKNKLQPTKVECVALPPGAARGSCANDASCPTEKPHCVQVHTVFDGENTGGDEAAQGAIIGGTIGLIPGAAVGAGIGAIYGAYQSANIPFMQCTDGAIGSSCGENAHCTTGGICANGFQICIQTSGNPKGSPCNEDSNCADGRCVGNDGYKQCRGSVENLTQEIFSGNHYRVPNAFVCFSKEDCKDPSSLCRGPSGTIRKFCGIDSTSEPEDGSLCWLNESGTPVPCGNCLACPSSGTRNWEVLNSTTDPKHVRMGSCRAAENIGRSCGGVSP